eukprot:g1726.t1
MSLTADNDGFKYQFSRIGVTAFQPCASIDFDQMIGWKGQKCLFYENISFRCVKKNEVCDHSDYGWSVPFVLTNVPGKQAVQRRAINYSGWKPPTRASG